MSSTGKTALQAVVYTFAHVVNVTSLVLLAKVPLAMLVYVFLSCGMSFGEGYLLHRSALVRRLLERTVPLSTMASTASPVSVAVAAPSSQASQRAAIKR